MLSPFLQPSERSACSKAATLDWPSGSFCAIDISTPTRRLRLPCCARVAPGHAAAPRSEMNSRRFSRLKRIRPSTSQQLVLLRHKFRHPEARASVSERASKDAAQIWAVAHPPRVYPRWDSKSAQVG